jgi:hypothetical protein
MEPIDRSDVILSQEEAAAMTTPKRNQIRDNPLHAVALGSLLLLPGCQRQPSSGEAAKISHIEGEIAALKQQNSDLKAKLAAAHVFGRSPLGNFFASPEFLQCTYDSSWTDCSRRCNKQTSTGFDACIKNHLEGPDRVSCINDNSKAGEGCLKACPVHMSPLSTNRCL